MPRTPQDVYAHRPPSMRDRARLAVVEPEGAKALDFSPQVIEALSSTYWGWTDFGAMYRRQPAIRSVVDFLARNIAQLSAKVYERLGNTDRLELDDHPLAVLLRQPNPRTSRFRFMRDTVSDIGVYDRAYWEKIRQGRQVAIVRIPPVQLPPEWDQDGKRVYRQYTAGRPERVIPRDRLVVFSGYHPCADELGVSPMETLRQTLLGEQSSAEHRAAYWKNAARQGGIIERPLDAPEWSGAAREKFREGLEAMTTGSSNAGRTMVLEEGMKWNGSAFSPKESEYVAGRQLAYEEVAIAFFGPIVGRTVISPTSATAESNHRQLYQDVFGPWLGMLQDEIELQLLTDFEMDAGSRVGRRAYVEFNLSAKLAGSFEEQSSALVSSTGVPYVSINESRARVNLPRIDDERFDMPVMPLNVMYGGQPAVTVPTSVPGAPPLAGDAITASVSSSAVKDALGRFFRRQRSSVLSTTKAGRPVDWARWDRELAIDLFEAADDGDLAALIDLAHVVNETTRVSLEGADPGAVFDTAETARVAEIAAALA